MFKSSPRGLILLGLCLLAVCAIVIPVVSLGNGGNDAKLSPQSAGTSDTAAAPALASVPAAAKSASAAASASQSASASKSAAARARKTGTATKTASASASAPAASAAASGVVYGFSDPGLLDDTSSAQQVQQLQAMKAIGVTSVRVEANWYWGQPTSAGSFDWTGLDEVVSSIQQAGLSADLLIDGCPAWAAASGSSGMYAAPASASQFATWAGAVAARYGGKGIASFEIWNEPNLAAFWSPAPDPAAYTADLKAAYAAIKNADPSAIVVSAGLAPATDDGTNYDPRTFLQDMYADGAQGSFDGLGFHPYSYPDSPDTVASWSGWSMMSQTSPSLRSIMAANGDSGKKIYITEYGAPTTGPNSVGESGQSTDLVEAIDQARSLGWVAALYIYTWSDLSMLSSDQDGFGVLDDSGAQKPSYSAVAAALAGTG